uniref:Uncharacterized protein n=1 Tax=Cacopsylla melanoneura TaxID=428564 RepID=A0A8D8RZP5_9HEMI
MLVTRVIWNKVEYDFDTSFMSFSDENLKIVESSKQRVDCEKVSHVIPHVTAPTRIEGLNPEALNVEVYKMIQLLSYTWYIASTVSIRIFERPRIHLIQNVCLPPFFLLITELTTPQ